LLMMDFLWVTKWEFMNFLINLKVIKYLNFDDKTNRDNCTWHLHTDITNL
jgi:hypothetical protein